MNSTTINYPDWKFPSKYAEEHSLLADWMIFGWHPGPEIDTSQVGWAEKCDTVDVVEMTPGNNDIVTRVPKAMAEKIVELRHRFAADLMLILSGKEATSDQLVATVKEWAAERKTFIAGETHQLREISERMVAFVAETIP